MSACFHFLRLVLRIVGAMSWLQSCHHVVNFSTWWEFQCLQDRWQDMAQNIIHSPWEGTKGPWLCLLTTLLLFSLFRLFSLVSAFLASLIKLILWLQFSTGKRQAEDVVRRPGSYSTALFSGNGVSSWPWDRCARWVWQSLVHFASYETDAHRSGDFCG